MVRRSDARRASNRSLAHYLALALVGPGIVLSSLSLHAGVHAVATGSLTSVGSPREHPRLVSSEATHEALARPCPACLLRLQNVGDVVQLPSVPIRPLSRGAEAERSVPPPAPTPYRLDFSRAPPPS